MFFKYILVFGVLFTEVSLQNDRDSNSNYPMYYTNSCETSGSRAIVCDEGYVIKIYDVRCMPYNYTCSEREKVMRLCDGLRSCSNIDLRRQLYYNCKDYPDKRVLTSFKCIPDNSKPPCRTNVCSDETSDIRCRRSKVVHLLRARCYDGKRECPTDVYLAIYGMCEGQRSCHISDLRARFPREICDTSFVQQENVFMDYICVDNNVVDGKCTGSFITQTPRFGVLHNPGYPNNPDGSRNGCYWAIYPGPGQIVDITVHLAYSLEGIEDCNSRFLQVQYMVCESEHMKSDRFCDEGRINVKIRSCGTVYVVHKQYLAGPDRGNRFLVSYAVKSPSSQLEAYEAHSYPCEKSNPSLASAKYTLTFDKPSTTTERSKKLTTQRSILPEDQPINDSSVSDPEETTQGDKSTSPPSTDPWRMVTLLRVVVVNIFLGLLIVALIMALVFICYRYKTYGREKKRNTTSKSNTATTLDDNKSTELSLLPDNEGGAMLNTNQNNTENVGVANDKSEDRNTFSSPPYETTIFHFNRPDSATDSESCFYDTGTGVSSFLPHPPLRRGNNKTQNPESAYSSLDNGDEGIQTAEYSDIIIIKNDTPNKQTEGIADNSQLDKEDTHDTGANMRESLEHYKINGVEYALVSKSPEHRKTPQVEVDHVKVDSPAKQRDMTCNSSHSKTNVVGESPYRNNIKGNIKPIAHIHPVPENCTRDNNPSSCHNHMPSTTMHVIPQHECLLHKIPPPPPPAKMPNNHLINDTWGPQQMCVESAGGKYSPTHYQI